MFSSPIRYISSIQERRMRWRLPLQHLAKLSFCSKSLGESFYSQPINCITELILQHFLNSNIHLTIIIYIIGWLCRVVMLLLINSFIFLQNWFRSISYQPFIHSLYYNTTHRSIIKIFVSLSLKAKYQIFFGYSLNAEFSITVGWSNWSKQQRFDSNPHQNMLMSWL